MNRRNFLRLAASGVLVALGLRVELSEVETDAQLGAKAPGWETYYTTDNGTWFWPRALSDEEVLTIYKKFLITPVVIGHVPEC